MSLPMKIFLAYGECTNKGGWRGGGEGTKKYVPEVSFEKLAPMITLLKVETTISFLLCGEIEHGYHLFLRYISNR